MIILIDKEGLDIILVGRSAEKLFTDAVAVRVVLVFGYARRLRRAVIIQFSKNALLHKSQIAGCCGPAIRKLHFQMQVYWVNTTRYFTCSTVSH